MTSPDGRPLSAYQDTQPEPVGSWPMMVNLSKLGEKIIMTPLAHLIAWVLGDDVEDWDTLEELRDNLIPALLRRPLEILAGIFHTGTDETGIVGLTAIEKLFAPVQNIIDTIFNGYHNTSETGKNLNDISVTMANVDNRLTNLEGGGVRQSITSSTTINLSGKTKVKGVLIGSSSAASPGGNQAGGAAGTPGGYVELPEIDVTWLATQVPDITAVSVVVGTSGGESKFGQRSNGTWVFETRIGFAVKVDGYSFVTCNSGPGAGGYGGAGYTSGDATVNNGTKGGDSMLAIGGAGGAYGGNGPGRAGGNGIQAPIDGPAKSGGSGGGGGGGGGATSLGGIGQSGGAGGHGAFPGGAPGGGGGRASNPGPGTTVGAGGSSANGYVELEAV
ncbi:hypothetical protein [Gordonia sp. 852002-10350_SCH5691597]|uniref:hypothetical protein n=1 Tax=Gordonia sp. 852002-10350_SCH5691597 TaxID=1834085 RepID=UPI0007EA34E9|nr:hypothetical protein [Gordonia sp. 852002-10350_SCH5691597]OBA63667.1 hypothetical protein A5777_00200 [Gordonia sp. 852002-10350_SCH5691597]